ncbi:rod shape-determining protein MreD [Serpentinicella sp. ANB-PHB4]|uniref:rod shape-determining protein MreD n=1 Tax=Serpentinicella sp. ANB-PHB4 TaxID=3074076 RepID=UPI00285BB15C|nr:rod shape-determining protein MreD [Serpentinicella sp. ANB-PHB4]MDR5657889.1 rod shape-determining protein MreD [Serpentinicella sp. ANB-PHB4]
MNVFIISLIIILNFIFQSTLLQYLSIMGVIPNTALILVVCFSLFLDKNKAATYGFVTGMLQDILYSGFLGMYSLIYLILGYVVSSFSYKIFKENIFISFTLTGMSTIFYILMNITILYLFGFETDSGYIFRMNTLYQIIYNAILSILIYMYVLRLYKRKFFNY